MEINKFSEFDEQRTPFADYIKILSDNGDNFDIDDIKYVSRKESVYALLKKLQYISVMHYNRLPQDVKQCIDESQLLLNSIEREQDGAIITAYHRGQPTK